MLNIKNKLANAKVLNLCPRSMLFALCQNVVSAYGADNKPIAVGIPKLKKRFRKLKSTCPPKFKVLVCSAPKTKATPAKKITSHL